MEPTSTFPEALPPFSERAEAVIAEVFGGLHNAPKVRKVRDDYWKLNAYGGLATFDDSRLTTLVFAAHRHCVRAEIDHSGPRRVKIILSDRKGRTGSMFTRHPDLQEALNIYYGATPEQPKRTLTCVYCGQEYPDQTPAHGAQVLTEHIRTCIKHPLRAAEAKIERLRKALMRITNVESLDEIPAMEQMVKTLASTQPDPDGAAAALDALAALRETA